jgi:hypothetical protein
MDSDRPSQIRTDGPCWTMFSAPLPARELLAKTTAARSQRHTLAITAAQTPPQPGSTWIMFAHTNKPIPVRVIRCSPVGTVMRVEYKHLVPFRGRLPIHSLDLGAWEALVAKGQTRPYTPSKLARAVKRPSESQ